ncbi:alginate export family protein [Rubrivirga sp. IMCC43871]|uniref:alginate export family protein n=1 Tax=Rubrivirga sp. IMCC43871 TaxID=3391575 RepID=UPI00398FC74F
MRRLALFALALATAGAAQPVAVTGEIRHRTELDNRDLSGVDAATPVHLLRTRLAVDARPTARVRAFVQVQDSRLWGGENPALALGTLDGSADLLDVHQAFFEVDSLGGRALAARVGRQEIVVGNQRLVGAVGWSNVGRTFDAVRLRGSAGAVSGEVFAAQLVTAAGASDAQALVGAVAAMPVGPLTAQATLLLDGDAAEVESGPDVGARQRQRTTAGLRLHGRWGPVGLDAEAYGQGGALASGPDGPRDNIRSWLGSAEVSTELVGLGLALGATRLSGDADPADGVDRRFDTLFATNHKFYGAMDYFPRGTAGLDDLFASVAWARRGWRLAATGHAFAAAVDVGGGRALGRELDLAATVPLAPGVAVSLGASAFWPTDRLGDSATGWGYLATSVAF